MRVLDTLDERCAQAHTASSDIAPKPTMSMTSLSVRCAGCASSRGMTSMNATYKNVPADQERACNFGLVRELSALQGRLSLFCHTLECRV